MGSSGSPQRFSSAQQPVGGQYFIGPHCTYGYCLDQLNNIRETYATQSNHGPIAYVA